MDDCFENCAETFSRMSAGKRCCLLSLCLGFMSLIAYIAVAIEGVEPTEYAIIRNNLSQDINQEEVLEGGLHWVGLFYSLIHFPSTHKSIEYSSDQLTAQSPQLSTRTKEGLELHIHACFQYQLMKDKLPQMYRMLQNDYEAVFTRIARNAILKIAGDFHAPSYWEKRQKIGEDMSSTLVKDLAEAYGNVTGFMLLKIDLPDTYEGAIVETEVTNQQKTTFDNLRIVNQTQQLTENIRSAATARMMIINAKAASNATKILNNANGQMSTQNIKYTTKALNITQQNLNFTIPKKSLLEYYFYQKIKDLAEDTKNKLLVIPMNNLIDINSHLLTWSKI